MERAVKGPGEHVQFDWNEQKKSVRLEVDQDRARSLGLTPQDIAQTLGTLLSGYTVTEYKEGIELVPVVARAIPEERLGLGAFEDLTIPTRSGLNAARMRRPRTRASFMTCWPTRSSTSVK